MNFTKRITSIYCSPLLVITEMQITTMTCIHQNGQDEKHPKHQHSDPAGWGVNLENYMALKTKHICILSPAVSLLDLYPTEM